MHILRPSDDEVRDWGRFSKSFVGAFGSGNPWFDDGDNLGVDGHLDLFMPCDWSDVEFHFSRYRFDTTEVVAALRAKNANPFVLHLLAYKLKKGFFGGSYWAAVICLNFSGRRVVFGWISAGSMNGILTEFEKWMAGDRDTKPDMETELAASKQGIK